MQLYHHPYSIDSQRVRLALEEKGIDYTSHHVNPLTGKNMDSFHFRMNPTAKLPVFQNGSHVILRTMDIIRYVDRVIGSMNGEDTAITPEVTEWMRKIDEWNPKLFTLSHIPNKYRLFVSRFVRRVVIARMAESPDLASVYHVKLRDAYEVEDMLADPDIVRQSEDRLANLLDEAEQQLHDTQYLAGDEFTLADAMFAPTLARITLLNLDEDYIECRQKIAEYYEVVRRRPSYRKVIGRHFSGWRKYRTLLKTLCFLSIRNMIRKY